MNCLIVTPHRLGIREMAERVGEEWEAMGHSVEYILARGAAARIGPITIGVPGIAVWWYRTLRNIAACHEKYDLIWTHQPIAPAVPTTDETFWNKTVATIHTTLTREYELTREGVYPKRLLPYYWLAKTAETRFHHKLAALDMIGPLYTVVSPHLQDEIEPLGIDQATYLPNGILTPSNQEFVPIRAEYDIPEDATVIFNIGSLTNQKRPVRFAELMRIVTNELNNTYVVMAGDGPLHETVESYTSESLHSLGYISDEEKWRWFADADIFASLSAYEGMPIATAEALSFELPVILSDIPSHRHLLEEYDATGSLVPDDADEIVTAIKTLQSKQSAVSLMTWRAVADQYLDIIQSLDYQS
jgi:glycosyltransferase involved in cell wall biosynthesis